MNRTVLLALGLSLILTAAVRLALRPAGPPALSAWPDPTELDSLKRYLSPVPATERLADQDMFVPAREARDFVIIEEPPTEGAAHRQPGWVINAILVTDRSRHAIINDIPVSLGDTLPGGARVSAIEPSQVTLTERGGTTRVLRVQPGEGQTP